MSTQMVQVDIAPPADGKNGAVDTKSETPDAGAEEAKQIDELLLMLQSVRGLHDRGDLHPDDIPEIRRWCIKARICEFVEMSIALSPQRRDIPYLKRVDMKQGTLYRLMNLLDKDRHERVQSTKAKYSALTPLGATRVPFDTKSELIILALMTRIIDEDVDRKLSPADQKEIGNICRDQLLLDWHELIVYLNSYEFEHRVNLNSISTGALARLTCVLAGVNHRREAAWHRTVFKRVIFVVVALAIVICVSGAWWWYK